jgi:hypothetical protein
MRLYRFLSAHWGLAALSERRLKIALIQDLNDPFELLGLNLRDKKLRHAMQEVKKSLSKNTGLLCFSKRWSNPVLWSHYANAHRGICLGFDVQHAHPITYNAERILPADDWLFADDTRRIEDMKLFLYTKFKHWEYEEEMRLAVSLKESDPATGHHYADFSPELALAEVIVGANCDLPSDHILNAAPDDLARVEFTKARLAFKSFSVVPNKRGFQAHNLKRAG